METPGGTPKTATAPQEKHGHGQEHSVGAQDMDLSRMQGLPPRWPVPKDGPWRATSPGAPTVSPLPQQI